SGAFLSLYLVGQRPSLGQVQILQETAGQILYRIKPGRLFQGQADLEFLQSTTRQYLGEDTQLDWEMVEELKAQPSGNYLFSRSTVALDYWQSSPSPLSPQGTGVGSEGRTLQPPSPPPPTPVP